MKLIAKAGQTSYIAHVFIMDSTSTTGAGKTGLAYNTASLTAYYKRSNGTGAVSTSLVNITTLGTFAPANNTDTGFKEIDATNMPGWYELQICNNALATGATSVGVQLKGATGMAPLNLEIQLDALTISDIAGAGFNASTDTLEKLYDAISSIAGAIMTHYAPTSATRITGTNEGGTYADLEVEDGTYFITGEVTTGTLLEEEVVRSTSDTALTPVFCYVQGYYNGGVGHQIRIFRYDYVLGAYPSTPIATMQSSTSPPPIPLRIPIEDRHRNASTGEFKLKFLHTTGTGNPAHRLYLNYISWVSVDQNSELLQTVAAIYAKVAPLTYSLSYVLARNESSEKIASADEVAAIKAQTDQLTFTGSNVNAAVDTSGIISAINAGTKTLNGRQVFRGGRNQR